MSSRRTVLAGALGAAATSAFAAAGCSSSSTGQSAGQSSGADPTGKPSGKVLLWDFGTEDLAKHEDPYFIKAYPEIDFTHVVHPPANYETLLQTGVTSPTGPDVVIIGGGIQIGSFAPALQPLEDFITEDQKANLWGWDSMRAHHDAAQPIIGLPINPQTWVT